MKTERGIGLFSATIVISLTTAAWAQPPAAQPENSPGEQARALLARARPQIVYNVRSRESAEALHAQSKPAAGDVSLPIDPGMPISLQLSRSNANAQAAAARAAQPEQTPAIAVPRVRRHRAQTPSRGSAPAARIAPGNAGHRHNDRGHGGD